MQVMGMESITVAAPHLCRDLVVQEGIAMAFRRPTAGKLFWVMVPAWAWGHGRICLYIMLYEKGGPWRSGAPYTSRWVASAMAGAGERPGAPSTHQNGWERFAGGALAFTSKSAMLVTHFKMWCYRVAYARLGWLGPRDQPSRDEWILKFLRMPAPSANSQPRTIDGPRRLSPPSPGCDFRRRGAGSTTRRLPAITG